MLHEAELVFLRRNLPNLFQADPVFLRLDAVAQTEALHQKLAERAARALGKQGVFAAKLHPPRKTILDVSVLADAEIAGGDADDLALVAVEHFRGGKARI